MLHRPFQLQKIKYFRKISKQKTVKIRVWAFEYFNFNAELFLQQLGESSAVLGNQVPALKLCH